MNVFYVCTPVGDVQTLFRPAYAPNGSRFQRRFELALEALMSVRLDLGTT